MATQGVKRGYGFPVLSAQKLMEFVQNLEVPLSKEELLQPTPEISYRVLEHFVDLFMNIRREDVSQPHFDVLSCMEYRELHEEAIGVLAFDRVILKMMFDIGVHDFSMKEFVLMPTCETMRIILSAQINYARFRQDHLALFQSLCQAVEDLGAEAEQLETQHALNTENIRHIEAKQQEDKPYVDALLIEVKSIKKEVTDKNELQSHYHREGHKAKEEVAKITSKIAGLNVQAINLKSAIEGIQAQIIPSPEGLRKAISNLETNCENERESLQVHQKKKREATLRFEEITKIEKELQKALEVLEAAHVEYQKQVLLDHNIKDHRARLDELERKSRELRNQEEHISKLSRNKSEQLEQLRQKRSLRVHAIEQAIQDAKARKALLTQERGSEQRRVDELQAQIQMVQAQMERDKEQHENHMGSISSRIQDLEVQVSQYHRTLFAAMQ
eukprot:TRINITY_DN10276_c0_g2_i1.p1 TRINITY_DN10276_c0_g2~~TRINITY_DN10276_c0_g2_i1.p1  ORF type:complete len:444 (+),score=113.89 TRINITY_DN10276_c0_g2_i1:44-1375(+)